MDVLQLSDLEHTPLQLDIPQDSTKGSAVEVRPSLDHRLYSSCLQPGRGKAMEASLRDEHCAVDADSYSRSSAASLAHAEKYIQIAEPPNVVRATCKQGSNGSHETLDSVSATTHSGEFSTTEMLKPIRDHVDVTYHQYQAETM
jgi:hypothetical protein